MRFGRALRRRPGVAESLGAVITMALTIVAGVAVLSYVRTQAAVSEGLYGQSVGQTVQYLEESFIVTQANFNYPQGCTSSCKSTSVTLYFYNVGRISNQFQQIEVYNSTRSKIDLTYTGSSVTDLNSPGTCNVAPTGLESTLLGTASGSLAVNIGAMNSVTLTLPTCYTNKGSGYQFFQGDTYFVKVLGIYGNTVTYYQVM